MCGADLFLGIIAILFPPLAVWVKTGLCSADSLINILLCLLGYIPGLLHAWYIIAKFPDTVEYERVPQDYEDGRGSSRVTYVFVPAPHSHNQSQGQQQPKPGPGMDYGTTSNDAVSSSSAPSHQDNEGSGSSNNKNAPAPPTYAEAVKGDHKIQSDD
ncbi:putative stress response RCI peptide [Xylariaceae sp. AK1471]|nr:putative stress response RCI peptide [Xylariaceae sp. AK1471]